MKNLFSMKNVLAFPEHETVKKKGHFMQCCSIPSQGKIVKKYTNNELTENELDLLMNKTIQYRLELTNIGIPIPQNFSTIRDGSSIQFEDELISNNKYVDFEDELLKENSLNVLIRRIEFVLKTLQDFTMKQQKKEFLLVTGLDCKPANLQFDCNGICYLVDLFVPKVRNSDETILYVQNVHALSSDILEFIHFNCLGIYYWFYYKLKEIFEIQKVVYSSEIVQITREKIQSIISQNYSHDLWEKLKSHIDTHYRNLPTSLFL